MNKLRIDYKTIAAIIPARGGSKGVPNKNIRILGGFPLIAYSIAIAQMSHLIDRVIVSTDSDEIIYISRKFGAEVPFKRPAEISGDTSTDYEFMRHAIDWFDQNERKVPAYWVHLRPTTPLRDVNRIDEAIKLAVEDESCDCLRSAHEVPESPFKWFVKNEKGFFQGILNSFSNEDLNKPRQQFPVVYIPDGYVDILKTQNICTNHVIHGPAMKAYVSPFCTEVDSIDDFEFLEYELKRNKNPLYEYLHSQRGV